jgi:hypothetical protein
MRSNGISPDRRSLSRLTNGKKAFLGDVDGRSAVARRFRDLEREFRAQLPADAPAPAIMLCKHTAAMAAMIEAEAAHVIGGARPNLKLFSAALAAMRASMLTLGLVHPPPATPKKPAKPAPTETTDPIAGLTLEQYMERAGYDTDDEAEQAEKSRRKRRRMRTNA